MNAVLTIKIVLLVAVAWLVCFEAIRTHRAVLRWREGQTHRRYKRRRA